MVVTDQFIQDFLTRARTADPAVRFEYVSRREKLFQSLSSLEPIHRKLEEYRGRDLTWDTVAPLVARISLERQRKYANVIKHLQKNLGGHNDHIFAPLNPLSVKLSKFQQRYLLPMLYADWRMWASERRFAEHGLCLNLALMWLGEQFSGVHTLFPRLADENVIASETAYNAVKRAAELVHTKSLADVQRIGRRLGLRIEDGPPGGLNFAGVAGYLGRATTVKALLLGLYESQHAVAIYREDSGEFLFFDSNAGSYRVQRADLTDFLTVYNNQCLPRKWPGYHDDTNTVLRPTFRIQAL